MAVDRNEFTGKVVVAVTMDVEDMDVATVQANLESLLKERLDQWQNEVIDYTVTTELFSS